MSWPEFFPPNCPPEDASGADGEIYIFISNDKPISESFTCKGVRFPGQVYDDMCMACGLSVAKSLEKCEASRRRVPSLRKKQLLYADLEEAVGRIKHTPLPGIEHHFTWWVPVEVDCPWGHFTDI